MPYNPAGLFSLIASYFATPGATIRTEQHNPVFEDVASALSSVLLRDGRAPMTGTLNMNGFPISNVATGSTPSSVATLAQAMPIGAVIDYALKTPPAGWLMCTAQVLLSNTPYQTLRTALISDGFPYGQDGSGNPKLPDGRGCVTAGFDAMGGAAANRLTGDFGATVGAQSYSIAQNQLPNVNLSLVGVAPGNVQLNDPLGASPLIYNGSNPGYTGGGTGTFPASILGNAAALWSVAIPAPTGFSRLNGNVTQQTTSLVQPTLILNKIIRVSYDA